MFGFLSLIVAKPLEACVKQLVDVIKMYANETETYREISYCFRRRIHNQSNFDIRIINA